MSSDNFLKKKVLLKEVLELSFKSFTKMVDQSNYWSKEISKRTNAETRMEFYINPNSVSTFLWRLKARIQLQKKEARSGSLLDNQTLKLHHFLFIYKEIKLIANINDYDIDMRYPSTFTESRINCNQKNLSSSTNNLSTIGNECTICLHKKTDVILPCGHSYCSLCTESWSDVEASISSHKNLWQVLESVNKWPKIDDIDNSVFTGDMLINHIYDQGKLSCPECRDVCSSDNELWNVLNKPKNEECELEMGKVLERSAENISKKKKGKWK